MPSFGARFIWLRKKRIATCWFLKDVRWRIPRSDVRQHGFIYELLAKTRFDGYILNSSQLCRCITKDDFIRFCEPFFAGATPVVSIGLEVPGAYNLITDGGNGLRALMDHLIETMDTGGWLSSGGRRKISRRTSVSMSTLTPCPATESRSTPVWWYPGTSLRPRDTAHTSISKSGGSPAMSSSAPTTTSRTGYTGTSTSRGTPGVKSPTSPSRDMTIRSSPS